MDLTLVIMAAGMGSRFGGDKQLEPVGPNGELIIDYSVIDAARAGFTKVVFVIRENILKPFEDTIVKRASKFIKCECVCQELDMLPDGFSVPEGRTKPWGTVQAVLAAKDAVDGPFAVINADDFYGAGAFRALSGFLKPLVSSGETGKYCLAGYKLKNTISDAGSVSRGICVCDENNYVQSIDERLKIVKAGQDIYYLDDGAKIPLDPDSPVSLNCFGFTNDIFGKFEKIFKDFLKNDDGNLKRECLLPVEAGKILSRKEATMKLLECDERWFGFTYKEDKEAVKAAIADMISRGIY